MADTSGTGTSASPRDEQVERVLRWIFYAIVLGFGAMALLALGQPKYMQIAFFGNAALAAGTALAAGAALGLLFGLPWRSDPVVVSTAAASGSPSPPSPSSESSAPSAENASESWYKDNTSLEQIAQWLTTSIIALTLVNFDGWVHRFERAATEVTCAMYGGPPGECGLVPGGVVLAFYAILGFLAGYLWARRYLRAELTRGIVDDLRARRKADEKVTLAVASVLNQSATETELPVDQAQLSEQVDRTAPLGELPPVVPKGPTNDPWKDQFGGRPYNDKIVLSANVTELVGRPGLFGIKLLVRPVDNALRPVLANNQARLYLHPTFPDPIKLVQFDLTGQIEVPLVAYGAFTVGLQLWDDSRVELDLSQLPDAPAEFRAR